MRRTEIFIINIIVIIIIIIIIITTVVVVKGGLMPSSILKSLPADMWCVTETTAN